VYIPGDILIATILPLSGKWNHQADIHACGGINTDGNEVIAEAFVFAVQTIQQRYSSFAFNGTFGALVFDACYDRSRALQVISNFESCRYKFASEPNYWAPSPLIVPSYITTSVSQGKVQVADAIRSFDKYSLDVSDSGRISQEDNVIFDPTLYDYGALVTFVGNLNWTNVGLLTSVGLHTFDKTRLFEAAWAKNICISFNYTLSEKANEFSLMLNKVRDSEVTAVLVFMTSRDVATFFKELTSRQIFKTIIVVESREQWIDMNTVAVPLGTVIFQMKQKQNEAFQKHVSELLLKNDPSFQDSPNIWLSRYALHQDFETIKRKFRDPVMSMKASDVIRAVDMQLHALRSAVTDTCGDSGTLCPEFETQIANARNVLADIEFTYTGQSTRMSSNVTRLGSYTITNLQVTGLVEVSTFVW